MKMLLARFLRVLFEGAHDESLRANLWSDDPYFSPYTASMFPRF